MSRSPLCRRKLACDQCSGCLFWVPATEIYALQTRSMYIRELLYKQRERLKVSDLYRVLGAHAVPTGVSRISFDFRRLPVVLIAGPWQSSQNFASYRSHPKFGCDVGAEIRFSFV